MDEAAHWRLRAEEARATADGLEYPSAKATMVGIAENYDRLALLAEATAVAYKRLAKVRV